MVYRSYPSPIAQDEDLITCAADRGTDPTQMAQMMSRIRDEVMAGMLAFIVAPTSWGLSAADWKAAWSQLAQGTDAQVETLVCVLAARTDAVAFDDGTPP